MNYQMDLGTVRRENFYSIPVIRKGSDRSPQGDILGATNYFLTMNGKPWQPIGGECHFSRLCRCMWDKELSKISEGGINVVTTYIFWNHHEIAPGVWDFSGDRDVRKFVQLCHKHGLFVIVRLGPFCHGEVRNGGFPDWMYGKPYELRSTDQNFLDSVRILYSKISQQLRGLYFADGGPIIGAQLDNEYMSSSAPWENTSQTSKEWVPSGDEGVAYLHSLEDIAQQAGINPVFFTCTGWNSPIPHNMLPLWGGYAYRPWLFYGKKGSHPLTGEYLYHDYHNSEGAVVPDFDPPYNPQTRPYSCCEMGGGMFNSYNYRFILPMKSVDALANIKLGSGCNFLGYYMFHGGTNPLSISGGYLNEGQVTKRSYDFQAAIGEFGQIRESFRRLRTIHRFVTMFAQQLSVLPVSLPQSQLDIVPGDRRSLRFSVRTDGESGFVFINNFQDHSRMEDQNPQTVTLRLRNNAEIKFRNIRLLNEENCILPFNANLAGITLVSATAQPIAELQAEDGSQHIFVFMRPDGMESSDFIFDQHTVCGDTDEEIYTTGNGEFEKFSVVNDARNVSIEIVCISRRMADRMTVVNGRFAVFLDDCAILYRHYQTFLLETTQSQGDLLSYPCCSYLVKDSNVVIDKNVISPIQGLSRVHYSFFGGNYSPSFTRVGKNRFVISLPQEMHHSDYDKSNGIMLSIRYQGDVGTLFIGDEMVSDNFNNGDIWEVDLGRYFERIVSGEAIVLHITPIKATSVVNVDSPMAARKVEDNDEIGELTQLKMSVVHCTSIGIANNE